MCVCILKNDHACKSMGFAETKNRENVLIESKENIKAWRRYNWNLLVLFMM